MNKYHTKNSYDDDNIPEIDLPRGTSMADYRKSKEAFNDYHIPGIDTPCGTNSSSSDDDYISVKPLPESTRPRKDGPGGN